MIDYLIFFIELMTLTSLFVLLIGLLFNATLALEATTTKWGHSLAVAAIFLNSLILLAACFSTLWLFYNLSPF
jgi:hypothetical protein